MRIATLLLLFSLPLLATTYYVSHSGSGTPPYDSWATATDSIGEAVAEAGRNDTIRIDVGEWSECIQMKYGMSIIGEGMDSTIISLFPSAGYVIYTDSFCTVEDVYVIGYEEVGIYAPELVGFTAKNVRATSEDWNGISYPYTSEVYISGCIYEVHHGSSGPSGIWENNIIIGTAWLVDNSPFAGDYQIFLDNIMFNLVPSDGSARDSLVLKNNVVLRALYLSPSRHTGAIMTNNTFCGGGELEYHDPNEKYLNNICFESATRFNPDSSHTSYNCVWSSGNDDPDSILDRNGNFAADPMFVEDYDFRGDTIFDVHLQYGSPCIDAGHPDPRYNDMDGSRNDIGAYGGPGGQNYLYLDLAPDIPDSFIGYGDSTHFHLSWKANTESELSHYSLYVGFTPDFPVDASHKVADIPIPDTTYIDGPYAFGTSFFYKLTASDTADHESEPTEVLNLTIDAIRETEVIERPSRIALMGAFPNPFNESAQIKFRLRSSGDETVILRIFDTSGRQVRTMSGTFSPGYYEFRWQGTDDTGNKLPSAMYFLRLSAGEDVALRTATIVR